MSSGPPDAAKAAAGGAKAGPGADTATSRLQQLRLLTPEVAEAAASFARWLDSDVPASIYQALLGPVVLRAAAGSDAGSDAAVACRLGLAVGGHDAADADAAVLRLCPQTEPPASSALPPASACETLVASARCLRLFLRAQLPSLADPILAAVWTHKSPAEGERGDAGTAATLRALLQSCTDPADAEGPQAPPSQYQRAHRAAATFQDCVRRLHTLGNSSSGGGHQTASAAAPATAAAEAAAGTPAAQPVPMLPPLRVALRGSLWSSVPAPLDRPGLAQFACCAFPALVDEEAQWHSAAQAARADPARSMVDELSHFCIPEGPSARLSAVMLVALRARQRYLEAALAACNTHNPRTAAAVDMVQVPETDLLDCPQADPMVAYAPPAGTSPWRAVVAESSASAQDRCGHVIEAPIAPLTGSVSRAAFETGRILQNIAEDAFACLTYLQSLDASHQQWPLERSAAAFVALCFFITARDVLQTYNAVVLPPVHKSLFLGTVSSRVTMLLYNDCLFLAGCGPRLSARSHRQGFMALAGPEGPTWVFLDLTEQFIHQARQIFVSELQKYRAFLLDLAKRAPQWSTVAHGHDFSSTSPSATGAVVEKSGGQRSRSSSSASAAAANSIAEARPRQGSNVSGHSNVVADRKDGESNDVNEKVLVQRTGKDSGSVLESVLKRQTQQLQTLSQAWTGVLTDGALGRAIGHLADVILERACSSLMQVRAVSADASGTVVRLLRRVLLDARTALSAADSTGSCPMLLALPLSRKINSASSATSAGHTREAIQNSLESDRLGPAYIRLWYRACALLHLFEAPLKEIQARVFKQALGPPAQRMPTYDLGLPRRDVARLLRAIFDSSDVLRETLNALQ
jgi:hypothetical protein